MIPLNPANMAQTLTLLHGEGLKDTPAAISSRIEMHAPAPFQLHGTALGHEVERKQHAGWRRNPASCLHPRRPAGGIGEYPTPLHIARA
mmetsp:Transcript_81061/g.135646  ORF Transcript_81061/g.135646 Transcript_81061/m.135646 type:complete len:89 (+) Transcript_81061:134-400(+)